MKAACLEKLPCQVDFPHISWIALFFVKSLCSNSVLYVLYNMFVYE